MNRVYRVVWSGVSLVLGTAALPAWAATCSPTTIANCSAAGGEGNPNLSGNGGSGNGGGGGSSGSGNGGATVQIPGGPTSNGTGGTGALNDSGQNGPGAGPGVVLAGAAVAGANVFGASAANGFDGADFGGGGGGGGAGVYSSGESLNVITGVQVRGGRGGDGGAGTSGPASNGGGGGGGGAAVIMVAPGATVVNEGTLTGGAGGTGGGGGNPGGGGGGGDGVLILGSGVQVTNTGMIVGGVGGAAGGSGALAGASGAGVNLAGGFGVLSNFGTIVGGADNGNAAGVGVIANGDVVLNGGTIVGGLNADGITRAAAIRFNGTNNVLQLLTGSAIVGDVDVAGGAAVSVRATNTGLSLSNNVTMGDATSQVSFTSNTADLVVSGIVSGAGKVGVTGNGTITFTGNNTYTGDTTITGGTLQLGNGGTSGSVAGNIVNNGTLVFNRADAVLYGANISGAGGLVQAGTGTLTIAGTGSYTGSTTVNGGTLALSGAGSIAASSGVVNNGTFDIANTTSGATINALSGAGAVALGGRTLTIANAGGTFAGVISGGGGLTLGGGTQTLSAVNAYAGATTINAGTLALSGAGSVAASSGVVNNGTFDIANTTSGATINALSGTGSVALGSRTLTLANAGGTFSGVISGSGGLTISGGTQTLSGANTYTGATTVDAGTLALSGAGRLASGTSVTLAGANAVFDLSAAGDQTVAHLSGVAGSRLALGARTLTLADGTSQTFSGTLSGNGGLVKQGAGMLTLNGVSNAFSGTTTVAGGTLAVGDAANAGAVLGGNVQVGAQGTLRGHGTILGDLSSSGVVAPGGSIGTLSVGGNYTQASDAALSIEVSPTEASQLRVGGSAALDGTLAVVFDPGTYTARRYTVLSAANGVSGRFANVTTASAGANLGTLQSSLSYGANAVDLSLADPAAPGDPTVPGQPGDPVVIAPTMTSIYTALGTTALLQAQGTSTALLARLSTLQDPPAGSKDVWIMPIGSRTKVGGSDNEPGFLSRAYGFLAGGEGRMGSATLGAAGGYTHTTVDENGTGSSGAIDTLRMALYGMKPMGPVNVSGTLGYALNFLSQKRPFGGVGTAEGDHLGHELTAATQASVPMQVGGFRLAPLVGLRYAYIRGNSFNESGANGQDLQVGSDNAHSLQSYVGLTLDKVFDDTARPVSMQLRAGYAHELLGASRVVQVQSEDGTGFSAAGTGLPRSFLTAGASVAMQATKATSVSLGVDAVINTSHVSAQSAYFRVNHRF